MFTNLSDLVGKDLTGLQIIEMHEVYSTDEQGLNPKPIGIFKKSEHAKVFAGQSEEGWYRKISVVDILTDSEGKNGLVLGNARAVNFFDDEEKVIEMKKIALAKLDPEERALLGFPD